MKRTLRIAAVLVAVCPAIGPASGQPVPKKAPSLAQLELTAEVAATTDDGYPAALRITLKNVGNVAVDMPVLGSDCSAEMAVWVVVLWTSNHPGRDGLGEGRGGSCGMPPLKDRVERDWVRLRPGEFMTTSENIRTHLHGLEPGTVEYWVEYIPPHVTPKEVAELLQAGYIIPTEKLHTEHQTFPLR